MFRCTNCGKLTEGRERLHFSRLVKAIFFVISLPLTLGWWVDDDICRNCTLQVYVMMRIVAIVGCAIAATAIVVTWR